MAKNTSTKRIVDGVRKMLGTREYSSNTAKIYLGWIEDFWRFHKDPYWKTVSGRHAEVFLDHLVHDLRLAPRTRNQAATSLAFLFREVFDSDAMDSVKRARGPKTIPPKGPGSRVHPRLAIPVSVVTNNS